MADRAKHQQDIFYYPREKSSFLLNIFFLSYKKVFVTNFVTRITNFVTCVRNFVTAVTKFVINFFLADSKKYLLDSKKYLRESKKFHGDIISLKGEWGHVLGRSAFQAHRPHIA